MNQPIASPTLDTLFRRILARHPDATALVDPVNKQRVTGTAPKRLTYAQADRAIAAISSRLRQIGLPADAFVGALDSFEVIES